ncbi:hypothetical protein, partial [Kitasatospora sp. NPDC097691]|uniref:hypothetical protein n=1 Tax=Kitasatospora sp. NPDC097691 TaxID=3157231 RepID=UPI00331F331C
MHEADLAVRESILPTPEKPARFPERRATRARRDLFNSGDTYYNRQSIPSVMSGQCRQNGPSSAPPIDEIGKVSRNADDILNFRL